MAIDIDIKKKIGGFGLDIKVKNLEGKVGILGASGAGKSLTLKCLAGIITPDSGHIEVNGKVYFDSLSDSNPAINLLPRERRAGYLFQNYALFQTMTVEKNIAAGIRLPQKKKKERVAELVRSFRLEGLEKRYPPELSGGQQQRTALARIIACDPDLILLDEPFSAMDRGLREELQHELYEMLEGFKGGLVMVSHDKDEIYRFADTLAVIDKGRAIISGPAKELFREPHLTQAAALIGCDNIYEAMPIDRHHVYCPALGTKLTVTHNVDMETSHIGIFARHIKPAGSAACENCISCGMAEASSTTLSKRYTVKVQNAPGWLKWEVYADCSMKNGELLPLPDHLCLPPESILILRKR